MEYARAAIAPAVCALVGFAVSPYLSLTDVAMVFLLGVALVAARYGRGPTIFASFLSIALFDFCFVPPRFTFAVSDAQLPAHVRGHARDRAVMSTLTLRIRAQAQTARERERSTGALYGMSRELAAIRDERDIVATAARHVRDTLGLRRNFSCPTNGSPTVPVGTLPAFRSTTRNRA